MSGNRRKAWLVLQDGSVFEGWAIGKIGKTNGEVVFNTSMTGYQEIMTDPSYRRQMIVFTYPHIGNVGVNALDVESAHVHVSGVIVRALSKHYSNYRAESSLAEYMENNSIVGIEGIDTRALVLHIRDTGAQMGIICSLPEDIEELKKEAKALPSMVGMDLVKEVSTDKEYDWNQGLILNDTDQSFTAYREYTEEEQSAKPLVIAIDFGVKYNILRLLCHHGFRVKVVPANTSAERILSLNPSALFLSNGPGDPAVLDYAIATVKALLGKVPMFGICLGHQILGLALGIKTYKLVFGHRGGNHPVRDESTGKVEITVQNHGFASDVSSIKELQASSAFNLSHINLNDDTIEGFDCPELKAFSVQYHPEASPGPEDSQYLFKRFRELLGKV